MLDLLEGIGIMRLFLEPKFILMYTCVSAPAVTTGKLSSLPGDP